MSLVPPRRFPQATPIKDFYLNVGCGLDAPETWVNLDASWNARLAGIPWLRFTLAALGIIPKETAQIPWPRNIVFHDVRRGLPYPDGAAAGVFSSHTIEHLTREDARRFLQECYRVLKSGGVIRLVTPDLEYLANAYVEARRKNVEAGDRAAERFLNDLGIIQNLEGTSTPTRIYRLWKALDLHKWLYDEASLRAVLERAGFCRIMRRGYLESAIPFIQDVKRKDRLNGALCLEAEKD